MTRTSLPSAAPGCRSVGSPSLPARKPALLPCLATLALVLSGCKPNLPSLPNDVVAKVGNRIITAQELTEEVKKRGISARNEDDVARNRRELLSSLIDDEAVVQRALDAGLDRDPEIQRRIRRLLAQEYRERSFSSVTNPAPTSDELRQWYTSHVSDFSEPSRVRGTLVSTRLPRKATTEMREIARTRLEDARKRIESASNPDEAFAEAVRNHSDDPSTRRQNGDTGWLVEGRLTRWPEEVVSALFSLPPNGSLCRLVSTPDACFLIRVKEREASKLLPFEEVLPKVTHRFLAESKERRNRDFLAEARRHVQVQENPDALAHVTIPIAPSSLAQSPPAVPGTHGRLPDLQH